MHECTTPYAERKSRESWATVSDAVMYAKDVGWVIEWSLDLLVGSDGWNCSGSGRYIIYRGELFFLFLFRFFFLFFFGSLIV